MNWLTGKSVEVEKLLRTNKSLHASNKEQLNPFHVGTSLLRRPDWTIRGYWIHKREGGQYVMSYTGVFDNILGFLK